MGSWLRKTRCEWDPDPINLPRSPVRTQGGELPFTARARIVYRSICRLPTARLYREMLMPTLLNLAPLLVVAATLRPDAGTEPVRREHVDLIELNHFVDDQGREVFRQVIFYDWSHEQHRFLVRGWRLVKHESQLPSRRWNPARYECSWHDDQREHRVVAPKLRETWSQRDPERVNRAWLPEDQRVPLFTKPTR